MTVRTIGTTFLKKTDTTITKRVHNTQIGKGILETTVKYGKDTPMVKKYGIDKVIKTKYGNSTNFSFWRGDSHLFHVQSNCDGTWRSIGGAHCASELSGNTTKEAIKNHFAMFKATLGL